ncbi:MAG: IS21-like element helper ATPase IstB [Propionibacteriaceae bacterium]|jgi:DNA replication protein DnaC|nr:IS21-like element helper ATPase IstB [Propionibacteriaceae bacterium]
MTSTTLKPGQVTTANAHSSQLATLARQLMWSHQTIDELTSSATSDQLEFLTQAMTSETRHRDETRRARLAKKAGFPTWKTFTGYQWDQIKLPPGLTQDDITETRFIPDHTNIVCYGPVGTGKTHLAIACGIAATSHGIPVRFTTVADLVLRLAEHATQGSLDRYLKDLNRAQLLILDEFGYVPIDKNAARLLFQIIADAYETRSLLITTNVPFSAWGGILADDQLAAALIDRVAHHGHLATFTGDSYRMRHALMRQQT